MTIKVALLPFKALLCKEIVVTAKESRMIHLAHRFEWLRGAHNHHHQLVHLLVDFFVLLMAVQTKFFFHFYSINLELSL